MPRHEFRLQSQHVGSDNEHPDWRFVEAQRIEAWKQLSQLYGHTCCEIHGSKYDIIADFSDILVRLENSYEVTCRIYDERDASAFDDFIRGPVNIPVFVDTADEHPYRSESLVEFLFYEMFLVMNLAAPGSFNFHFSTLERLPINFGTHGREITTELGLHAKIFEDAFEDSVNHAWLKLGFLPVCDVMQWLLSVAPRFQMVPTNPAAKCLFALLYLTKSDFGPASSAWVFNALEALFSCKPGENFGRLTERAAILLELRAQEVNIMKKKLRTIYEIRSSFVHGGMRVVHPMRDDGLDSDVHEDYWSNAFTFEFGSYVALASLQSLIRRRWLFPMYEEKLTGQPMLPFQVS